LGDLQRTESRCRRRNVSNQLRRGPCSAGQLGERDQLLAQVEAEVAEAVRFADASPYPGDEELTRDVYA